jgi:hypothetical protein
MSDDTIAELMARDPFQLSKLDIDKIIEFYREKRAAFKATGKPQAGPKPSATLEELGL